MRRSVVLPVVALGLLALAPWQAAGVFQRWQALAQSAPRAQPQAAQPPSGQPQPASTAAPRTSPASRTAAAEPIDPTLSDAPAATGSDAVPPVARSEASPASADGKFLDELNRRAAELDKREHDLRTWATQIAVAEKLARAQLAELGQMRADVEKVVAQESTASDEDLAVLVGLYSNMKPAQAAALLGRLNAPVAAAILEKLDIHSAGPALAAMEPTVAVAITEELSRRHAPFRR
jgi:flagellar motility protein MotE (MotC chaperone)